MSALPVPERIIFVLALLLSLAAGTVGVLELFGRGAKYRRLLGPLVSLVVTLLAVILVFRAAAIKAVPLTGLFESMIVLTIVFGLIYLFLSIAMEQVWFGSVMVWVIVVMVLLAGVVARPASEPHEAAVTPWAIAHGIAMVLAGAAIAFATACAFLCLLGRRRLKQKKVMDVLGKVPNIEKLMRFNLSALRVCFVMLTLGLASGIGLAAVKSTALGMGVVDWLTDPKIVLIIITWILLAVTLIAHRTGALKDRTVAYVTMVASLLLLYAIVGSAVICKSKHDFSSNVSDRFRHSNEIRYEDNGSRT